MSARSRTSEWKLADSRLTACQQVKMMDGQMMHICAAFTTSGLLNRSHVQKMRLSVSIERSLCASERNE